MSARISRKRARIGLADKSPDVSGTSEVVQPAQAEARLEEREQDEEFWFDDGNIIVVARDVGFRVYRGLLADCSPVLRELFSISQTHTASSSATVPTLGACPVVHVSDCPEDFRHLLRFYMPRDDSR